MSSSYGCELELRDMAEKLHGEAYDLEKAADLLEELRNEDNYKEREDKLGSLKKWAKDWLKRDI